MPPVPYIVKCARKSCTGHGSLICPTKILCLFLGRNQGTRASLPDLARAARAIIIIGALPRVILLSHALNYKRVWRGGTDTIDAPRY